MCQRRSGEERTLAFWSHLSPPLKSRIGYCIVTKPFLTQRGQWSGNETRIGYYIVSRQWGQWSGNETGIGYYIVTRQWGQATQA